MDKKLIEYTAITPAKIEYAFKAYNDAQAETYVRQQHFPGTTFVRDEFQHGQWNSHNGFEGDFENMKKTN